MRRRPLAAEERRCYLDDVTRMLAIAAAWLLVGCYTQGVLVEDDEGDTIYLEYDEYTSCSTGRCHTACPGGGYECVFSCSGGGCLQLCEAGSDCRFTCSGGGCDQRCGPEAHCQMACSGGGCAQSCATEFGCSPTCSGSGCSY